MRISICEDDVLVANMLSLYVEELGYKVCSWDINPESFLENVKNHEPDLVLMDINLGNHRTGIDMAKILRKISIPVIFITAYSDSNTLSSALELKPLAYLVKPFTKEQLKVQLQLAQEQLSESILQVKESHTLTRIDYNQLIYFESDRNYTIFHMADTKSIKIRGTLKQYIDLVPADLFVTVHRSFVINKNHLIQYNREQCELSNRKIIPVGRSYRSILDHLFLG